MDLINVQNVFAVTNLFYCFLGCVLGTIVGVFPGLGPASTIAILLPVTMRLDPTGSVIMLAGLYYGAMYGGSTTSILVNIPGEAASVVTCIDGFQMTKQGRAGQALWIAAVGSFIAGTFGAIAVSMVGPGIAKYALKFGPPEYHFCSSVLRCSSPFQEVRSQRAGVGVMGMVRQRLASIH
jgi:putative tricarboxylic transport membrane protein